MDSDDYGPEVSCTCGHGVILHTKYSGLCTVMPGYPTSREICPCEKFVLKTNTVNLDEMDAHCCSCSVHSLLSCGLNKPHLCEKHSPFTTTDKINHPLHYGGADNPYEAIKVIEAWKLGFNLGNTVKYICREGQKIDESMTHDDIVKSGIDDLKKAAWYLNREIEKREKK